MTSDVDVKGILGSHDNEEDSFILPTCLFHLFQIRQRSFVFATVGELALHRLSLGGNCLQNQNIKMWRFFIFAAALYAAYVEGETHYGQSGKDIKMRCGGSSSEVFWKHNDNLIFRVDKGGKVAKGSARVVSRAALQGSNILIKHLESEDKGTYTCTSIDRSSRKESATHHTLEIVTVSVSVTPASPLLLSSSAKLTCEVKGIAKPKIIWRSSNTTREENPVSLDKVEKSGTWTCQVEAQGMTFEASLDVHVIGLSAADKAVTVQQGSTAVLPCSLSSSSKGLGSLRVVGGGWRQLHPAAAGGPQLPTLKMNNTGPLLWDGAGIDETKVDFPKDTLSNNLAIKLLKVKVEQAGSYKCSVKFEGRGTLEAEVALHVTGGAGGSGPPTGPSSNQGRAQTRSWLGVNMWIWVGVGAGSLVLIALVVAVVLIYQGNKRKKMRLRKLRSVRKPLTANDYCQCNRQPRGGDMNRPARGLQRQHVPENIRMNGGHGGRQYV
ncbi:hypothetical protein ACEWY4_019532 [Coilia grayii]|uniref:Ig-like domain-containing protein n=1 Tax=Coilia grayii TaxID=363190 RepID=A0ABD1JAC0_9TELE